MKHTFLQVCMFFAANLTAQPFPGKIGVGLDGPGGPSLELPNVTRTATAWQSMANGGNATTDAQGWPTEDFRVVFFDHRPYGAWAPPPDDPQLKVVDVSGTYKLSFTGQATLTSWSDAPIQFQNQQYDVNSNTTTVDIYFPPGGGTNQGTLGNYGFLMVNFSNTNSGSGAGVKDIRLTRPGYPHQTPQYYRIDFLNALSPFQCIRFMDYLHTNAGINNPAYPAAITWASRQQVNDPRYDRAMPWEYVIALGNYFGRDIWINIPAPADDDYVTQLATLVRDNLRPDVNIYLEYSNEVWNGSFPQYQYNYDAVLNAPDDADIRNSTSFDDRRRARRAAKRVIRIGQIFGQVMGVSVASRTRIRPVFAWQIGGWLPWYTDVLDWINNTYGPPKDHIYAIASAPYFNDGGFGASDSPQQVVALMSANSDTNVTAIKTLSELAAQWQILHLQYEGGPDNGGGNTSNLANRIYANRIPEMKTAVVHNYADNWFSANAHGNAPPGTNDLANYFVMSGGVSRYGCWGATEDLGYLSNLAMAPKYDALCTLTGQCGNEPTVGLTAPVDQSQVLKGTPVILSASASDPDGSVAYVEFFAGARLAGTDSTAPYSITWIPDSTGYEIILAKAVDDDDKYRFGGAHMVEVLDNATGIKEDRILAFTVHPNPAREAWTVQLPSGGSALRLFNIQGQCIYNTMVPGTEALIPAYTLAQGLYILEVELDGSVLRRKILK